MVLYHKHNTILLYYAINIILYINTLSYNIVQILYIKLYKLSFTFSSYCTLEKFYSNHYATKPALNIVIIHDVNLSTS